MVEGKETFKITSKDDEQKHDLIYLDEDPECKTNIETITYLSLELLGILASKPSLYYFFKVGLLPLFNCVCQYLMLTHWQEQFIESHHFVSENEEEMALKTIRNNGIKIVSDIIEKFGDDAVQSLLVTCEKFIMNSDNEQTIELIGRIYEGIDAGVKKNLGDLSKDKLVSFINTSTLELENLDFILKKKEVSLLLLGSFAEDIIVFHTKNTEAFNMTTLINFLINELKTFDCFILQSLTLVIYLRGRFLWTLAKFCEIIGVKYKEEMKGLFFEACKSLIGEEHLLVRLAALRTIDV